MAKGRQTTQTTCLPDCMVHAYRSLYNASRLPELLSTNRSRFHLKREGRGRGEGGGQELKITSMSDCNFSDGEGREGDKKVKQYPCRIHIIVFLYISSVFRFAI